MSLILCLYLCLLFYSAQSNQTNKSRLKVLQTREQHLQSLFDAAREKLDGVSKDQEKYKKLLGQLILQVSLFRHSRFTATKAAY